ncbi:MAG TPA: hypothetical protein VHS76_14930 [Steroidobacteraceae bacterium]|nr:hypothetical protein [Steroidobacteraceae bacterium]
MILAFAATLAIVVSDHTPIRAAPSSGATELTALSQGDVLEIRGERAGYLKVYNYRRERGGYLRADMVRPIGLTAADAAPLLAVLRFLRETPGSEALGISYGAAYLKAIPTRALTAEPLDAIARMAERLADAASGNGARPAEVAAHLEVVQQFGIHMRSFERAGRMQVCYDGELFRRVLAQTGASSEERAQAGLGLTRPDCIDPDLGPAPRATLDDERRELLDQINEGELSPMTRSRLHARRAAVLASIAFEQARRGDSPGAAAERAHTELLAVNASDLGNDRRAEYEDAVLRVSAVRWAFGVPIPQTEPLRLSAVPGDPGQTCVALSDAHPGRTAPLVRRCTYGIVWMASAQTILKGPALVLAVQPLESWRELWLFHEKAGAWTIDVLSPGADDPEEGYVEFAGFAPGTRRLLIAREVKDRGRFRRRFEELRLDDLALVRQASSPELLRDFGWWQDMAWRRDTLALH